MKSAKVIFNLAKKARVLPSSEFFDVKMVNMTYIKDEKELELYGGFIFAPNTASMVAHAYKKVCFVDAAHCQKVGTKFYETTFELDRYGTNHHWFPCAQRRGKFFSM